MRCAPLCLSITSRISRRACDPRLSYDSSQARSVDCISANVICLNLNPSGCLSAHLPVTGVTYVGFRFCEIKCEKQHGGHHDYRNNSFRSGGEEIHNHDESISLSWAQSNCHRASAHPAPGTWRSGYSRYADDHLRDGPAHIE